MIEAKQNGLKFQADARLVKRIRRVSKEQIENRENSEKELQELKNSQASILTQVADFQNQEKEFSSQIGNLKQAINTEMEALRDLERENLAIR